MVLIRWAKSVLFDRYSCSLFKNQSIDLCLSFGPQGDCTGGKERSVNEGEMGAGGPKVPTASYEISTSWGIMYSLGSKVNNTVLYIWKLLREYILTFLTTRKKMQLCVVMDVNKTDWGDHFAKQNKNIQTTQCEMRGPTGASKVNIGLCSIVESMYLLCLLLISTW